MSRVLLVEDDILLARQFERVLAAADHEVTHAGHAGEALVRIDERLPDIIILDMLLPVTSGVTLLHELQSYVDTRQIPIVICTSLADSVLLEELKPYGVRRLIDKTTMHPSDLVSAVRAVL